MGPIRRFFGKLRSNLSGNATMLVAIGMPAMIGGAGYAVDTAQWYMWKSELQHSVDQAAYAGAWALARSDSASTYNARALQEYDANLSKTKSFASRPNVKLASYAGGANNSIIVTATASKSLPFSSFLTGRAATIRATAQASFAKGATYNACLVSLAEDGTGTSIGGNATVRAQCGLAALSCSDDAINIDGSAHVSTDSIVTCGTATVPAGLESTVTEKVTTLEDIYKDLTPPTNNTTRSDACTGTGNNKQASLLPGTYKGGLIVKCKTTMASGIYVIDGGDLDLTANYNITGTGVMFILKNGATMKFGGSGNGNKVTLTPPTAADFIGTPYADKADKYAGILVFEDRDNNAASPGHILNGNSNSLIEGLIYLPDGNLRINGTANVAAQCLQISAYTLNILGNATLETLCPTDKATSVGSSIPQVKMVR